MTLNRALGLCAALILLQGLTIWLEGHVVICKCGYVKLWENSIWSSGNSQHIADWYTLGHVNHGILFAGGLALILWRWSMPARLLLTGVSGFLWETIENTALVIDRFRAVTISLDYYGDSVVNSMSDSVFMLAGFLLASRLPVLLTVLLFAGLEAVPTLYVRDGLVLDTIMLIHPVQAIKDWQLLAR